MEVKQDLASYLKSLAEQPRKDAFVSLNAKCDEIYTKIVENVTGLAKTGCISCELEISLSGVSSCYKQIIDSSEWDESVKLLPIADRAEVPRLITKSLAEKFRNCGFSANVKNVDNWSSTISLHWGW
jgi:hypothetical protein